MRIVCFTDSLGSGGAQRQLTLLASLLKKRGHEVLFMTYIKGEHYAAFLEDADISRIDLCRWPKYLRPLAVRNAVRENRADVVIAFQEGPSLYAELAGIPRRRWQLIVSERNAVPSSEQGFLMKKIKLFHLLADKITTNSYSNRVTLEAINQAFANRVTTIYNAVDLKRFRPCPLRQKSELTRFVVLSSHKPQKNFAGLAAAVKLLREIQSCPPFRIDWYGDEASPGCLARNLELRKIYGAEETICFHQATREPERVLAEADALILPSLWEGLPNVVCEALASGCPVLISRVSDACSLVQEGQTGFLFDPCCPRNIKEVILRFLLLSAEERQALRKAARESAELLFATENYVAAYESLFSRGANSNHEKGRH